MFIDVDNAPNCRDYLLETPFLAKQISTTPAIASSTFAPPESATGSFFAAIRPINFTLLSLGFVLLQIMLGRPIDDLSIADDTNLDCILKKQAAASRLNGSVEMLVQGGFDYQSAAQWCLDNLIQSRSFDDEKFCDDYHKEVIARLEADMEHQLLKP